MNKPRVEDERNVAAPTGRPAGVVSKYENEPCLAGLLELFLSWLPEKVAAVHEAFAKQDWTALAALTQQVRTAAGGYGFPSISELATQLEADVRAMRDLEGLAAQIQELDELCRCARGGSGTRECGARAGT